MSASKKLSFDDYDFLDRQDIRSRLSHGMPVEDFIRARPERAVRRRELLAEIQRELEGMGESEGQS